MKNSSWKHLLVTKTNYDIYVIFIYMYLLYTFNFFRRQAQSQRRLPPTVMVALLLLAVRRMTTRTRRRTRMILISTTFKHLKASAAATAFPGIAAVSSQFLIVLHRSNCHAKYHSCKQFIFPPKLKVFLSFVQLYLIEGNSI